MRQSGGHVQRFCTPRCRLAFHAAARRWTVDAIEAGVLSIQDIKNGAQPTCTLPHTASAPAPMPTSIPAEPDAPRPHMPTDHHLALSSPGATPIIDQIVERLGAHDRTASQVTQEMGGVQWEVKRESAGSTSQRDGAGGTALQRLAREWGGEVAVKTYSTAAAAQILLKHLGRDLSAFLAIADRADLGQVMAYLHAASLVQVNAAPSKHGDGKPVDEPPLPFVN